MIHIGPFPCTGCMFTKEIEADRNRFWYEGKDGFGCKYMKICPHFKNRGSSSWKFDDAYFNEFAKFTSKVLNVADSDLELFKTVLAVSFADLSASRAIKDMASEAANFYGKEDNKNGKYEASEI